jgi:hypothetical protein
VVVVEVDAPAESGTGGVVDAEPMSELPQPDAKTPTTATATATANAVSRWDFRCRRGRAAGISVITGYRR